MAIFTPRIYNWLYNLITLNLYELSLKTLSLMEIANKLEDDLYVDFLNLKRELYSKLEPSLRHKVKKRGISIIQNSYIGFDSEYKSLDSKFNKLLSVQMAYNTRTLVKIPKESRYELSTMHPLRSESYKELSIRAIPNIKIEKLEETLNSSIERIREIGNKKYDISILQLLKALKNLGIPFIEREDMYFFTLPLSPIKTLIYFNEKDKGLSFKEMVKMTNNHCEPILNETYLELITQLEKIHTSKENPSDYGEEIPKLPLEASRGDCGEVNSVEKEKENLHAQEVSTEEIGENVLKRMSRTYMQRFTEEKLSITRIRNSYFIAHLTNADLSILSDFEELKPQLDIVNKSFVTLGKPLVIENTNVYIRDTMLLTPAMSKSLDSIGMLYGFEKMKLTREEITNMDVLLATDKKRFTDYAVRDAVIPLIHGNFMEHFNFQLKGIGIPITLSNLGLKYVKHM
jgi:hypothetical protein